MKMSARLHTELFLTINAQQFKKNNVQPLMRQAVTIKDKRLICLMLRKVVKDGRDLLYFLERRGAVLDIVEVIQEAMEVAESPAAMERPANHHVVKFPNNLVEWFQNKNA